MKETSLADINDMEDGMPIPQLFGHVKTVFERKRGEGEYGPWSFQDAILTDGNTDVRLKFKGMEDALSLGGKDVTIRANKSKQHGLTGVVKVVEQFDGKTYHKVQLTNSCKIVVGLPNGEDLAESANPMMLGMAGSGPGEGASAEDFIPMTHDSKGTALPGVDEARKHIMQSVNLMNLCLNAVDKVVKPNLEGTMTADMFQACVLSVFIDASRSGFISKMPATPLTK